MARLVSTPRPRRNAKPIATRTDIRFLIGLPERRFSISAAWAGALSIEGSQTLQHSLVIENVAG